MKDSAVFANSSGEHRVSDDIGRIVETPLGSDALDGEMRVGKNPNTGVNYDDGYLTFVVDVDAS